jgi:hypothetical protein
MYHRASELSGSLYENLAYLVSFIVCCFKTRRVNASLFLTFAPAFKPTTNLTDSLQWRGDLMIPETASVRHTDPPTQAEESSTVVRLATRSIVVVNKCSQIKYTTGKALGQNLCRPMLFRDGQI